MVVGIGRRVVAGLAVVIGRRGVVGPELSGKGTAGVIGKGTAGVE